MNPQATLHGVLLAVEGVGLLITGPSGSGKSELALELVMRGHPLVADDAPVFVLRDGRPWGRSDPVLQDYLEVRGLGLLDLRALRGDAALRATCTLDLVVELLPDPSLTLTPEQRLHGLRSTRSVLGCEVPCVGLAVSAGRNLAVLVETAARQLLCRRAGQDHPAALIARQQAALNGARP